VLDIEIPIHFKDYSERLKDLHLSDRVTFIIDKKDSSRTGEPFYKNEILLNSSEVLSVGDGVTLHFSGITNGVPLPTSLMIDITGADILTDNGLGVLTGLNGGSGVINYETGEYSYTLTTPPAQDVDQEITFKLDITKDYYVFKSDSPIQGFVTVSIPSSETQLFEEGKYLFAIEIEKDSIIYESTYGDGVLNVRNGVI
jgi:hypothetical protein